ncbi:MAG: tetratricopeptide repeat protein [Acidobacteriota bacterium]|nr:tetratricopeptide repeat protein [Acidobacteriota bacterium]
MSFAVATVFSVVSVRSQTDEASDNAQHQAITLFEQGQNAHEKGDLNNALKLYEQALKLFPEFPEAEYQRGAALVSLGNPAEAEKAFRRAVELRGDWSLAWAKLGDVLVDKHSVASSSAPESEETKQIYGEAVRVLQKAIELDSNNFPAMVALAELRLRYSTSSNTLNELLAQIRTATDGKANVPAAVWAARGALERRLKDGGSAKNSLQRALTIDPQNATALLERAQLFAAQGDTEAAIIDLQAVVRLSLPKDRWRAQMLLAGLLAETGKTEEARKILETIDEAAKNQPEVVRLKNALLVVGAEGAEGIELLERTLKTDPKNVLVLSRLCSLNRTVNPQKALDYCRRAQEIEPTEIKHAVGFGAALVQARQFPQAVDLFRKLLAIEPKNFTARQNLALALYELKRYNESIEEFERLIEAKPDAPVIYFYLATANDFAGNYVAALAAYQKFLELAKPETNQLEIDKVKLRLPAVADQVKRGAGKKKKP